MIAPRGRKPRSGRGWIVVTAAAIAVAVAVALAAPAGAHALRVSSTPDAGAVLTVAPKLVTVTFGEQPDPHLSKLRVLDSSGHDEARGPTTVAPGHPLTLQVALGPLGDGVYTVNWTTVSEVDGHLAGGTFAFGVGVTSGKVPTTSATATSAGPSVATTVSRWLLYVGLMLLVGGAAIGLSCFDSPPRLTWPRISAAAWALALVGAAGITLTEAHAAHLALDHVLGSTFAHQLAVRTVPLLVGAALLAVPGLRRPRRAIAVLGLAGLIAMWGDVTDSHAGAATRDELLKLGVQWVHFVAAGIWIGGLVTLLVGLGALSSDARGVAARRFSAIALVAVVGLAGSGVLRAIDEVGSWHALTSTSFGRLILVKGGLLLVLIGLGAVNRFRSVPAVSRSGRPLARIGRIEVAVVVVVLVATAILQGLAPPSSVAAASGPPPLVVTGNDFATTVKVRLAIAPGTTGFNQFDLVVTDYDTGQLVRGETASLSFSLPGQHALGTSTLALHPAAPGHYQASGANLSIDGTWRVTALLQRGGNGTTIELSVTPRRAVERVTVQHSPGIPDLYTVSLPSSQSLQVYLDPGKAGPGKSGFNEFHATYLGADGKELPMRSLAVAMSEPGRAGPLVLQPRRLDSIGHFVADVSASRAGRYRFELTGVATDGATYQSTVTIPVVSL